MEKVRYFLKRFGAGNCIIYQVRRSPFECSSYRGHGRWNKDDDIIRRYLNGFDADVDEITEEEALKEMAKFDTQVRDDF